MGILDLGRSRTVRGWVFFLPYYSNNSVTSVHFARGLQLRYLEAKKSSLNTSDVSLAFLDEKKRTMLEVAR